MNAQSEKITSTRRPDGSVASNALAKTLLVTKADLASANGLSKDAVWRYSRSRSERIATGITSGS